MCKELTLHSQKENSKRDFSSFFMLFIKVERNLNTCLIIYIFFNLHLRQSLLLLIIFQSCLQSYRHGHLAHSHSHNQVILHQTRHIKVKLLIKHPKDYCDARDFWQIPWMKLEYEKDFIVFSSHYASPAK